MTRILANAASYWVGIFALGFVLGAVRVLWLAPRVGLKWALAIELPIMLAASWVFARRLHARRPLPSHNAALAMGGIAFALLIGSEVLLATQLFGATLGGWASALTSPEGRLGLAGQIGFGALPGLVWRPVRGS
ncbi:hypothetical protein [Novosphingobium sp.]|uniref:hypothetical protein n=1 Tax=Novosphingobium sp. TaxID=1874826 RepID=UPI0035B46DA2